MRGLFTAGVLDIVMEKGIEFDGPSECRPGGLWLQHKVAADRAGASI